MTKTCMLLRHGPVRPAVFAGVVLVAASLGGCDLVDVTDPTRIEEQDVSNAVGADLVRRRALLGFQQAEGELAWLGGLLADEFLVSPQAIHADQRNLEITTRFVDESRIDFVYASVGRAYEPRHRVRHDATLALRQLRGYAPESSRAAHTGQMLAVRGYTTLRLGEDFCPGFPLHELDGYDPVYGPPLTTEQVFERALADLDSAVVLAADSARILDFARVVRGRTLLNLGHVADAAAAVAHVPTDYVLDNESGGSGRFIWTGTPTSGKSVGDREGDNGLDFVSADDPRLQTTGYATAADGITTFYQADKFLDGTTPIVLASGLEARLIEAEAALAAGGPWLDILNELRATQVSPAMEPLDDPGSAESRVDLLFRERAFWLFGTGHRLGDLRRLVRDYGRSSETVFPSGNGFGTVTSLPFPYAEEEEAFSPEVTGCTSL